MVWGVKTPISACANARVKSNFKPVCLAATGLGILLAMSAPGQLSRGEFTSPVQLVEADNSIELRDKIDIKTPAVEPVAQKPPVIKKTASVVQDIQRFETEKPVQMASLDLNIPLREKPKVFIPPKRVETPPVMPSTPQTRFKQKPRDQRLFGSVELRFDDERKIKAWASVYYKFTHDVGILKECINDTGPCQDPVMQDWALKIKPLRGASNITKIARINDLANRQTYSGDRYNYGRSDYWAGPREFLTRGGDCEDYALLKFASLLALGVPEQDLRLVVGRLTDGTPHAFLAANIGAREYILDNRETQVYLTNNRNDYIPKYSMNLNYRWSHVMPKPTNT